MSEPHAAPPGDDEPPAIEARSDTGSGFWNIGWPLLALALMVLMTVHACVK